MNNEDCYKIVGTSREAAERDYTTKRKRTEGEKDIFIQEHYEHTIKMINNKKQIAKTPDRIAELENQEKKVEEAYARIATPLLRDSYDKELDAKIVKKEKANPKEKTAYDMLNTSVESLKYRTDEENNKILATKKDELIADYQRMITAKTTFAEKQKIELAQQEIIESYELVKTPERRKIYGEKLRQQQEEKRRKNETERIRQKYSHASKYEPRLIHDLKNENSNVENKKMILREENKLAQEYYLLDEQRRNLRIKETAKIIYKNAGNANFVFYEYQVKRRIDGKEQVDTIYTEISIFDLSIDKKTGKKFNPKYYDCVANNLLAEETIEGAQYNGGYIGMVEQHPDGEYDITLKNKKLIGMEQERLTVSMMISNARKKKEQEKEEETCQK